MLTAYLKRQWKLLLLLAGAVAVFAAVFALYSLPVEAVAYAGLLCLMLGLVLFALGYSAFLRRHRELEGLLRKVHESVLPLPPPRGVLEADYQALLRAVCADRVRLAAENRDRLENCYYNDLYLEFRPAGRAGGEEEDGYTVCITLQSGARHTLAVLQACGLDGTLVTQAQIQKEDAVYAQSTTGRG